MTFVPPPKRGRGRPVGKASIDWDHVDALGVQPDEEVAQLCGVRRQAVASARRRLGIPAPRCSRRELIDRIKETYAEKSQLAEMVATLLRVVNDRAEECVECGAAPGARCTSETGRRLDRVHHLRGRTNACGPECSTCREWFTE